MSFKDREEQYSKDLKKFFQQRIVYSCYKTIEKTDYRPQRLINVLEECTPDECIKKVYNFILSGAEGLKSLEPYGKEGLELSLEAIVLENKDYQKLFGIEAEEVVKACKFNLEQVHYFDK